ncbi:hypothetical protein [Plasticicumulans acidivorans]|uniref:Uncharacterized protein n=1 Tax=Plasticicumulans acidivorans TaxID=886464 RepID=A0A317N173_9GAMM|nr:hypothetical protein [Plasticicumulans acidivorans]PWV66013.1 hypothetical protein C7443_101501 [Plasticicumulans acidivorans]
MSVRICDAELDALRGLPYAARVLYLMGLRPCMDYRTGVAGRARRITYQQFREVLGIDPVPGVATAPSASDDQIKRLLAALERAGLIQRCSRLQQGDRSPRLRLIVRFLLAETDLTPAVESSVQIQAATRPPRWKASTDDGFVNSEINQLAALCEDRPTRRLGVRPPRPPVSGNKTTTTAPPPDPQLCGGDEDQRRSASAQRELPLIGMAPPVPIELPELRPAQRTAAARLLREFDPGLAQQIADEWAAAIVRGVVRDRLAYLHGLVRRAQAGTFAAESGAEIAAERDRRRRMAAAVAAAERASPVLVPIGERSDRLVKRSVGESGRSALLAAVGLRRMVDGCRG